jgi:hypothetical protein
MRAGRAACGEQRMNAESEVRTLGLGEVHIVE